MAKRSNQDAGDIARLAQHFRSLWKDGQVLQFWLRLHAEELRAYIREEHWCWHTLGLALTEAGVTYRTGTTWNGENLRRSVDKALRLTKRELKRQRDKAVQMPKAAHPEPDVSPEPTPPAPPPASQGGAAHLSGGIGATPPEEEFQLIRSAESGAVPPVPLPVTRLMPKPPRPRLSAAEVDAIVMGRSARR